MDDNSSGHEGEEIRDVIVITHVPTARYVQAATGATTGPLTELLGS